MGGKKTITGYSGGEPFLVPIAWEEDHVMSALKQVKRVIESNDRGPGRYIRYVYGQHESILKEPFSESFQDVTAGEMTWQENEKV